MHNDSADAFSFPHVVSPVMNATFTLPFLSLTAPLHFQNSLHAEQTVLVCLHCSDY